jgi:hypothetical protein
MWLCANCDTSNPDYVNKCEVCGHNPISDRLALANDPDRHSYIIGPTKRDEKVDFITAIRRWLYKYILNKE